MARIDPVIYNGQEIDPSFECDVSASKHCRICLHHRRERRRQEDRLRQYPVLRRCSLMKQKNHRLNSVSAGTEAVMHVVLALFSLCCIIPFIFGVIISKQVLGQLEASTL